MVRNKFLEACCPLLRRGALGERAVSLELLADERGDARP